MTSADDRSNGQAADDVWAQVVAEDAERQARRAREERERAAAAEGARQRAEQEPAEPETAEPAPAARPEPADPLTRLLGESPFGSELGPLVDEVRRLATTVGERLQRAQRASEALAEGAQGLEQLTAPLREKHPEVYRHLAAAGNELLAAYRAAVSGQERRWTGGKPSSTEHIDLD